MWVADLIADPDSKLRLDNLILKYDLWRTEDLLMLYDPLGKSRLTMNGMSRELRRAGMRKVAKGFGCRTAKGQCRLWALRNVDKYTKMHPNEAGAAYDKEREMTAAPPKKKF